MKQAIRVEHLAYSYPGVDNTPGVAVFKDLNLTVEPGSFVAVLGSNGCGKSTLAKHCNSILLLHNHHHCNMHSKNRRTAERYSEP